MKVLFEITHPAHVHLFRHAIAELEGRDHAVRVTSRDKGVTVPLLDAFGIQHELLSKKAESKLSLITEWGWRELRLLRIARVFRPDTIVSHINPAAVHVARLVGANSLIFNDGENTDILARVTNPFAHVICTPEKFGFDYGAKHRRYRGYHELAYLHPQRFTPDDALLREHGVDPGAPYSVLRFISWGAFHDVGQHGITRAGKRRLVELLADIGPVYITSEGALPSEFEQHHLPVPPQAIHDLLARATIYAGDSGTMATEAALLGVPAVRISTHLGAQEPSNFIELEEEFGLLYSTTDEEDAFAKIETLLSNPNLRETFQTRRERLLEEKVDVTEFMVETILDTGQ